MHACEWRSAMNELVEQDAQGPDVERVIVVLVLNHLRSHVLESPAKGVPLLHVIRLHTPPEITDLNDIPVFDKNILWLDVSMNEPLLMQIVNTWAHLYEEIKGSVLAEELLFSDQIK